MIFDKVLQIYHNYFICVHCLGRMFSLLGSNTTNQERGHSLLLSLTMEIHKNFLSNNKDQQKEAVINLKLLAEKANFSSAQAVLKNEGIEYFTSEKQQICYLCEGIFSEIGKYVETSKIALEGIQFDNFLVGTTPDSLIVNREDRFKSEYKILEAESFKSHFNRVIGKELFKVLRKEPEFSNPDVLLIFFVYKENFEVKVNLRSLFVFGRYNKFIRGIPQTHWFCNNCKGIGCKHCNFSGKQYNTSVEELMEPMFINESKATDSKFHGAGREDIDVRMLGNGRPFIIELKNPKVRTLDLVRIEKKVNRKNRNKIKIQGLRYSSKKEVIKFKTEAKDTKKTYKALVKAETKMTKEMFGEKLNELKFEFENKVINQRTPNRVSHRRADKIRVKTIYSLTGKFIKSNLFEFLIKTQGGTYIKELISGDNGRTSPSFTDIFRIPLLCKKLDVLEIAY